MWHCPDELLLAVQRRRIRQRHRGQQRDAQELPALSARSQTNGLSDQAPRQSVCGRRI
jgi:hypothetical protein